MSERSFESATSSDFTWKIGEYNSCEFKVLCTLLLSVFDNHKDMRPPASEGNCLFSSTETVCQKLSVRVTKINHLTNCRNSWRRPNVLHNKAL